MRALDGWEINGRWPVAQVGLQLKWACRVCDVLDRNLLLPSIPLVHSPLIVTPYSLTRQPPLPFLQSEILFILSPVAQLSLDLYDFPTVIIPHPSPWHRTRAIRLLQFSGRVIRLLGLLR